jgi:hypothetical protein
MNPTPTPKSKQTTHTRVYLEDVSLLKKAQRTLAFKHEKTFTEPDTVKHLLEFYEKHKALDVVDQTETQTQVA